ncbi:Lactoylglutathione lyase [Hahella chejuensis KCTC 2396]|uniref:Lactoylglutathione lyase n=1 Tax=Hahella chejuensis (strain KCTC 2396) TaxID=349521 RepID=Q2SEG2_HAHCH|nr:VOC family protein [Hahella chejuensis]ABC30962.1 Lactoylglutathione lyase [Hahella chejuensis KCTC 2396]
MKPRISMITLGVEDLQRSVDFYENGLGLPKMPMEDANVAFFTLNGTWLGLYPRHLLAEDAAVPDNGSGFKGVTLAHNLASKAEVDAQIQQAVEAGAKLTKPAEDTFWGGYSGYFADPDGHLWEIAWNPHAWVGPEDK